MNIAEKLNAGVSFHRSGELEHAASVYREILDEDPGHFDALRLLGVICAMHKDFQTASTLLNTAVQVNPSVAIVQGNLAMVQAEMGEFDSSIASSRAALLLDPKLTEAHCALGVAYQNMGDTDAAISSFEKAIGYAPNSVLAHSSLGALYAMKGDFPRSVHHSRVSCHLQPNQRQPHVVLMQLLRTVSFNQSDASLKRDLLSCFMMEGLRHSDLAVPTASVLLLDPELRPVVLAALESDADIDLDFFSDATVRALNDPLLLAFLQNCTVPDPTLELFLTKLRKCLLRLSVANTARAVVCLGQVRSLVYSLAQLCFYNEYLYSESAEEAQILVTIHKKVSSIEGRLRDENRLLIALYACYRELHRVDNAAVLVAYAENELDPLFSQLLIDQLRNPITEAMLREQIKSLVVTKDVVTQRVQAQYEENPFPRWRAATRRVPGHFADELGLILPHVQVSAELNCDSPAILIAGCGTGIQAIYCAYTYANARITAVDISLASLAYAKRMTQELGIDNIDFVHANILELGDLDRQFDMIECYGVLHHLSDPRKGLQTLTGLLRKGGFMTLGLYSELARQGVVLSRQLIAQKNYPATLEGIRTCRRDLLSSSEKHIRENVISAGAAFWTASEVRDLVFHANEYRYSLPEIAENLEHFHLEFLGFTHQLSSDQLRYKAEFPDDTQCLNLENWHHYEQKYPRTFANMYHFWVRK